MTAKLGALSFAAGESDARQSHTESAAAIAGPQSTLAWKRGGASQGTRVEVGHSTINLGGRWLVRALQLEVQSYADFISATSEWMTAEVPGEIHLDLMRAGRMPDPNVSVNARTQCRWPEQHSWWYRTEFVPPQGLRGHSQQRLIFEGIDLSGQVYVNGQHVGSTLDTFTSSYFDVKGLLTDGSNELVVRVTSGMELASLPGRQVALAKPPPLFEVRSHETRRVLRKPAYNAYGWDWCDPLPNIGIWRNVQLKGRSKVTIHHLRLDVQHLDHQEATLEGEVILENVERQSTVGCLLELSLCSPRGHTLVQHVEFVARLGRVALPCRIVIPKPELWWPNGMGKQSLYRLSARVLCGNIETDRMEQAIGLRMLELDCSALGEGSRFSLKVNGQNVFCRGANWAPADLIPARIDSERYGRLVEEARNAHFTMLRVNGTGLYESDEFYDACDRAGILVWQDFTFSFAEYPDHDPAFLALVRAEAESVVRRVRHHPSLAIWCGNNECTWGFGSNVIYSEVLPDVCRIYDPGRLYWPGSPSGGQEPNSETAGDYHWWGTDGPKGSPDDRYAQEAVDACRARFVSEYGVLGPPVLDSLRQYLKPDELSPESTAWKIHTNMIEAALGPSVIDAGIRQHYGDPGSLALEQRLLYGQMVQAVLQGRIMEGLRFRKADPRNPCAGALVWSFNDAWGEIGWSLLDYYGRRKASYYWFKRAAAPVKVLIRPQDGQLITRIVNDTPKHYEAKLTCGWVRLDGGENQMREQAVVIPSNGVLHAKRIPLAELRGRDPRAWLYAATLAGDGIPSDQAIWLFKVHRDLALPRPVISVAVEGNSLRISSPVYCHGVHLEDGGRKVLADNYFELLPGTPVSTLVTDPSAFEAFPFKAVLPIP